jgi:dienelactone hydrolase
MLVSNLLLLLVAAAQAEPARQSSLPVVTDDFQENEPALVRLGYHPDFLALFDEFSFTYTGGGYREKLFRYRLFVPETSGPEDKRPLIVWLHGVSTSGEDNYTQLRHLSTLVFTKPWEHQRYPFFLLAIQCPHDNHTWTTGKADADDMLSVLSAILDKTLEDQPIDPDRVSLTGVSSGGGGAWEFALRRPEVFSCVAPIASSGADSSRISRLASVPVWAFHSREDQGSPVEAVRSTVAALKAAGGMAHLTEVDMQGHNCWNAAFLDYELLPWMLAQKRGEAPARPIGEISAQAHARVLWHSFTRRWTFKQALAQVAIPLVLLVAIWSARRQRRLRRSRLPSGTSSAPNPLPAREREG